ncbi:ABC transporter ATP-binding protein [Christensenellaceae bacterium NSJ-44]|uniref:ABC transporter ATP-binding protein n=1 Tax=Luoshenia tenuis TaxID=2763654 RepID=A0A926D2D1_9FIRM|nr:ABC transporter ATP-binding protein [Luoshenia tenuis]MBC8530221.1 ABC transporter ATP-binding protein [Luoshenia tenuis]
MEPIMTTQGLCRDFQTGSETVHALRDINLSIMPGELTLLRGRSGSGKTTLMNLLSTLDRPTAGQIVFNGRDITTLPDRACDEIRRKEIGYIFQSVALISLMSAYENVEFSLRISGYPAKERQQRAEECLNFVGLGKRMNHRPSELSGGEQQRVAIARALSHRPSVIFADEPTAELDTRMGLQVMRILCNLVEQEGVTVVMTSHDPQMGEIADQVITLADGEMIEAFRNENARGGWQR